MSGQTAIRTPHEKISQTPFIPESNASSFPSDAPGHAPRTLEQVQWLRAVAALMVLLFHLGMIETKYSHGPHLLSGWTAAGEFGVDLFFVISGFIMTASTRADWGRPGKATPFLLRRVLRIYPIYWEFSLVVLAGMLMKPEWVNSSYAARPDILRSFLLLPQSGGPLLAVGWSLTHEMYFYLVFCLLFLLPVSFRFFVSAWAAATLAACYFVPHGAGNYAWAIVASPLTLEFMFGALAGACYLGMIKARPLPGLGVLGIILFAAGVAQGNDSAHMMPRALLCGTGGGCLLYSLLFWPATKNRLSRVLSALGDASYSLYLSHVLVLSALGHLWARMGGGGVMAHGIWLIASAFAACYVAWLNFRWIEQPLHVYVKRKLH